MIISWPLSDEYRKITTGFTPPTHWGIDISCPDRTPVYAAHAGTARYEWTEMGGYCIRLTGNGITTRYVHIGSYTVNDGACTETGNGLYKYVLAAASVDANAEYVAVFHTAGDVDQADLPAMWSVGRAGTPYLDASIADVQAKTDNLPSDPADQSALKAEVDAVAADVWSYASRTLTQSAASVAAAVAGSTITCQRGDTLVAALTGLGDLSDRVKLWGTVKADPSLPDTAATLMTEETDGLTRVNGAAYTTITDGDITVTDEVTGALTWTIKPAVTKDLAPGQYTYDLQKLTAAGVVTTVTYAQFIVTGTGDITRAVA